VCVCGGGGGVFYIICVSSSSVCVYAILEMLMHGQKNKTNVTWFGV
jgi:hypothetical protein